MRKSARGEPRDRNAAPAIAAQARESSTGFGQAWDPYDVWLSRIHRPRKQRDGSSK